jgi:Fe2+ or Zn2+ uptake regulation protein
MKDKNKNVISLDEVIAPALHAAFLRAAERAKQTHTYLVIERKGKIERISYEKIDSFISQIRREMGVKS